MTTNPIPFTFVHSNRRVVCSVSALDGLTALAKEFKATRCVVVMDGYFQGGGVASRVSTLLREATGIEPVFHFVPGHEPDTASIEACASAMTTTNPDFVVAIGGGSAWTLPRWRGCCWLTRAPPNR